jgi:hypothetical protein
MNDFEEERSDGYSTSLSALLPPEPVKVFFSYAHQDRKFRDLLGKHLTPLVRAGYITQWYDGNVQAGAEWAEETYKHLNTADIILLLISSDFMASDFCYHVEMTQALKRHVSGQARVIPILLRPTYWKQTPIGTLQALPREEKPVSSWRNYDEAFVYIVRELFEEMKLLLSQQWVEKSEVFADTKYYEHALRACDNAIGLNSKNISAYMSKASLLWHLERYEQALSMYEHVISLEPENIVAHMSRSYALWILGRYRAALQACEHVLFLDPENGIAHLLSAYLYGVLREQAYQRAHQIGLGKWQEYLGNKYLIMKPDTLPPI